MKDKQKIEMLKEAIALELWIITLYEDYIPRIKDKRIKAGLIHLVEESLEHKSMLRKELHKIEMKMKAKGHLDMQHLKELLNAGLREELLAQAKYRNMANKIGDKGIISVANRIFRDEVHHEKIVRELMNLVK